MMSVAIGALLFCLGALCGLAFAYTILALALREQEQEWE